MKIRNKISLTFSVMIFFVSASLLTFFSYQAIISTLEMNEMHITVIADIQKARLKEIIANYKQEFELTANRTGIIDALNSYDSSPNENDKQLLLVRLQDAKNSSQNFESLYILDKNGKAIVQTENNADLSLYYEHEEHSADEVQKSILEIGFGQDEERYLVMHGPIKKGDAVLGDMVIIAKTDIILNVAEDFTGLGQTGEVTIVTQDENGDVIFINTPRLASDSQNITIAKDRQEVPTVKALIERKEGFFPDLTDYRNSIVYAATRYIPETNWGMVVKIDKAEIFGPIYRQAESGGLIGVGILILTFVIIFFIARFISRPLVKLNLISQKIGQGNYDIKAGMDSRDEIGELSRSFDDMSVAIKKSRAEVDQKVKEQTGEIIEKSRMMEDQQKAILNILEDVEEEKEKALEEKAKDEALLESIGDGVVATDKNGVILFLNNIAIEMLGLEKVGYIGKMLVDYVSMTDQSGKELSKKLRPMDMAIKKKARIVSREYNYLRKDGSFFNVAITVAPIITNKDLIGTIEVFRDITQEKVIDKAKTEFVSLASHQLRTPLSAINWYAEMLLAGDAGKLNKEQKSFVSEIYSGNQRMVNLVNALLNVSRIELGTLAVDPVPTDFSEISHSLFSDLKQQIAEKKLKIKEKYDPNVPKINADPNIIRIIFQNLVTNAVKYTPEKGVIAVSIEKQEKDVLIKVADTGYGIPENQKPRIFEKLFRADNVKDKDTGGTGLGLYLVKSIVDDAKGKLWFDSEENKGTIFYITIPLSGMKKKEGSKTLSEETI